MGRKAGSALAAACTSAAATQLFFWSLFLVGVLCFPQPPTQNLPVRYPGGSHRGAANITRSRTLVKPMEGIGSRMVVFPDEYNPLVPVLDMTGNPSCASESSKSTFCEHVDNYPTDDIRRLVHFDKTTFRELFGPASGVEPKKSVSPDDLNEEGVCSHQLQTFFPKMARNNQNYWRYVINDVDYVQAVEAEVCVKEGKACAYVQDSLPGGHQSICRQRFSLKKLLAIDPDHKKTYIDSFRFASCCSCYVKVPRDFGRSGRNRPTTTTQFPSGR